MAAARAEPLGWKTHLEEIAVWNSLLSDITGLPELVYTSTCMICRRR